jgi:hypothetical protein
MITRKAAIGFILLAIIVFSVSSYDTATRVPMPDAPTLYNADRLEGAHALDHIKTVQNDTHVYRPPLFDFGDNTPVAMTVMVEAFALVCYLVAKRIEPDVIAWEKSERERVAAEIADEREDPDDEDTEDE